MGKSEEIRMSRIAGKVRALASLDIAELKVALPIFLGSLEGATGMERFDQIVRALGQQAAKDAVRLGVVDEWIEDDQDPRDICYETWEAEHGEMVETLLEASAEEPAERNGEENVLDNLFSVYADAFESLLDLEWEDESEERDEDAGWDDASYVD